MVARKPKLVRGTYYWPTYLAAQKEAQKMYDRYPNARVVEYDLGYAVQLYISGPYLPIPKDTKHWYSRTGDIIENPGEETVEENPRSREIGRYVNDFDTALAFLGDTSRRELAHNTYIVNHLRSEGHLTIFFHKTEIVWYYPDGRVTLNSGGYHTATTKQRMNELLPPGFSVEQRQRQWSVRAPDGSKQRFFDGITIQGPLPVNTREKLLSLSKQMTKPEHPGHMPNPRKHKGEMWVDVWEERDRVVVTLYRGVINDPNESIVVASWVDDEVRNMIEDGFFKAGRQFKASILKYAEDAGLV